MAAMDRDAALRDFASRLKKLMVKKGWNQSELARQAKLHMPDGRLGRDNISSYCGARSFPGPIILNALCQALHCEPEDLIPTKGDTLPTPSNTEIDITATPDGEAMVHINRKLPWPKVTKILEILHAP